MISKKKLWEAQLREYPTSQRLTIFDVLDLCNENNGRPCVHGFTFMKLCLALQYPNVVYYRIPTPAWLFPYHYGFRYGLDGGQYATM